MFSHDPALLQSAWEVGHFLAVEGIVVLKKGYVVADGIFFLCIQLN